MQRGALKMIPRLKTKYEKEVVPSLKKQLGYTNIMQVPRLLKIVVNCSLKDAIQDKKILDTAMEEMALITGQKPLMRRAKKSVSAFKLRKSVPIGAKVTLRRNYMYEFFDRLVNVAIPRIRDFQGFPRSSFDGRGNYSFGIEEQLIFPEISYEKIKKIHGFDITIATSAENDREGEALLEKMGFPFEKRPNK
jgi:large subunit ribosomal protein L5